MTGPTILSVRSALGLTQAQLATVIGVSWVTVSKWERGVSVPAQHPAMLLDVLAVAVARRPRVGDEMKRALALEGIPAALFAALRAVHEP